MNLVLIGFTSCGKSAVGAELARRLSYSFVDLDTKIVKRDSQHRSCREIFTTEGEDFFRALETAALQECASLTNTILSTGGGTVLHTKNHKLLREIGTIAWIHATPETLFKRMNIKKGLPSFLQSNPTVSHLEEVLNKRIPFYKLLSPTPIITDTLTVDEVVDTLIQTYFKES